MSYAMKGLGQAEETVDISSVPASPGRIRTQAGWSYQITPDDLLWLARSVQHETGNYAATAWTYAQLLAMVHGGSLKRLVMEHSQPVNPIWRRDGEKCRPGGPYHGRDECAERRLAVRDRAASMPWSEIRPVVREIVVKFATARLPNPVPRAANFANAPVTTSYLLRHPTSAIVLREGNWYITERQTNSWPADFVTITDGDRVAGPSLAGRARAATTVPVYVPGLAVLAAGAAFAWWAYKKRGVRRNRRRRGSRRTSRMRRNAVEEKWKPRWVEGRPGRGFGYMAPPRDSEIAEAFANAFLEIGPRWVDLSEVRKTAGVPDGIYIGGAINKLTVLGLIESRPSSVSFDDEYRLNEQFTPRALGPLRRNHIAKPVTVYAIDGGIAREVGVARGRAQFVKLVKASGGLRFEVHGSDVALRDIGHHEGIPSMKVGSAVVHGVVLAPPPISPREPKY